MDIQNQSFSATATGGWKTVHAKGSIWNASLTVAGTGSVNATVVIEVCHDPNDANDVVTLFTLSAAGTNGGIDSAVAQAVWPYWRARCSAISASTAAMATVSIGGA